MEFTLRFNMDSDAFSAVPGLEAERILDEVARRLRDGEESAVCRDYNGNTVGGWEITGG
jgi:hypothetical protein